MTKRRRWILLPLAALAALLLVVLALFDWNWLKGPVESAAWDEADTLWASDATPDA